MLELALLRLLAVAHRERLDVRPLIENLAAEFRGTARRQLRRLARHLATGVPLIDALEQTPELLRDEDVLSLRFANSLGTLPQTYAELIQRTASRPMAAADQVHQAFSYGIALTIGFSLLIAFMTTFISPTFIFIFEEFGLNLPPAFGALRRATNWIAGHLPLPVLVLILCAGAVWFFRPVRRFRRWMRLPPLRWSAPLQRVYLLRMLAQSGEAGRPLPAALSTLARYHFDSSTRMKLLVARNEIEQGADAWGTLAEAHLLSSNEAQALANASTSQLRNWIMRRLAQQKEEVIFYRRAALAMLVHPAIVLLFGAIVAWVAVAYFSILVTMITVLS